MADLLRHDAHHGTQYAATLDAWLAAQGDVRTAARRLAVHPNTLRYRLARLSEVTPVRLDDPAQRLAMAVALAVAARRGQVPSAPADQDQRPAQ